MRRSAFASRKTCRQCYRPFVAVGSLCATCLSDARRGIAKRCSCGAGYSAAQFLALAKPAGGDVLGGLRLRNCPACKSTMAAPVGDLVGSS
jgi:hypothetical protein